MSSRETHRLQTTPFNDLSHEQRMQNLSPAPVILAQPWFMWLCLACLFHQLCWGPVGEWLSDSLTKELTQRLYQGPLHNRCWICTTHWPAHTQRLKRELTEAGISLRTVLSGRQEEKDTPQARGQGWLFLTHKNTQGSAALPHRRAGLSCGHTSMPAPSLQQMNEDLGIAGGEISGSTSHSQSPPPCALAYLPSLHYLTCLKATQSTWQYEPVF